VTIGADWPEALARPMTAAPSRNVRFAGEAQPTTVAEPLPQLNRNDDAAQAFTQRSTSIKEIDMPKDAHNKAAEHHETAAKSHKMAAEHHGRGDHKKGQEESSKAQAHSKTAREHSDTAHKESQAAK
jgi:hypothetical protein